MQKMDWTTFKDSGFLWFVNRILHVFGVCIVATVEEGRVTDIYPAFTKYEGFTEEAETRGFERIKNYLKEFYGKEKDIDTSYQIDTPIKPAINTLDNMYENWLKTINRYIENRIANRDTELRMSIPKKFLKKPDESILVIREAFEGTAFYEKVLQFVIIAGYSVNIEYPSGSNATLIISWV